MKEDGVEKKIVFSGDIGSFNKPLIRDPIYTKEADYAVMESTYGDRFHQKGRIIFPSWSGSCRKLWTGAAM